MKAFPNNIKFKYSWRKYQARVLDGLDEYLEDRHLHVIAPPGSGKTVLGLEVAVRINNPTLILAPTLAIRNQWIQKFCELFLQTEPCPDWISRDVRKPGFLTVITYQSLHAACNNSKAIELETDSEEEITETHTIVPTNSNFESIISGLQAQQIKTIVVDEAHHLKNEWWHTLLKVKNVLDPVIIGLTATPPYDVSANEWQRYIELNGPVDVEISVPELVIEGDLCPHQDYVFLSHPNKSEISDIVEFRQGVEQLFGEIKNDPVLIDAIINHPFWINPAGNLEWIYTNLSCYSACLIFLHANGILIPETHLGLIDDKKLEIPVFDYNWAEILLSFYLFNETIYFKKNHNHQKSIENKLRRYGALDQHQISFSQNKQITTALTSSVSKLESIKKIVDFEYEQLRTNLRLVILTDYIRKEFYADAKTNDFQLGKIGVLTIFEKLRRENNADIKVGVLTGSVVIVPKSAYASFHERVTHYGLFNIACNPVPFDDNYMLIEECDQLKNEIVNIITQLFQQGEIEVLIGTKSLLGEGWDAPAINALVLASFVGSFVLSNQMRGRAIRTQKDNLEKTGNIWHLCCIDPTASSGGDDFEMLKRRFKGFVGISFNDGGSIENGIRRLNIPENMQNAETISYKNQLTFDYAGNRKALKDCWKKALENGVTLTEEIKVPFDDPREYTVVKHIYLNKTIANLFAALGFGLADYLWGLIQGLSRSARMLTSQHRIFEYLGLVGLIGILLFGRLAFKAFRLFIKYRDISKDIRQIGEALLNTMVEMGLIKTDASKLYVDASVDRFGAVYCHLDGGTTFERSAFINMLQEIIKPVDNPRYVIIRRSIFMLFIKQRDFHSVPEQIGRNKDSAILFKNQWEKFVGSCNLIFTRTIEGRKLLLKSRIKSLAAQFENGAERINKWT